MDIAGSIRGAAPVVGLLAGTAAVGAGISYGAIRAAGESDGGTPMVLLGTLGGSSLAAGGFAGFGSWIVASRHGGSLASGPLSWLLIPAGIGGSMLGGKLAHAHLRDGHADEYTTQERAIDQTMEATRQALRDAGAGEGVLSRVPESYDRSYFNASYHPQLGPFGDKIKVGRLSDTGKPLAADDVIAHEFTHKVLHAYAPELLSRVPGSGGDGRAIHESVADTIAMVVDDEDWLVGEDAVEGGIRSFSHPELHGGGSGENIIPAPITRKEYDGGEEHLGAGVGNKAAWRIGDALGRDTMAKVYVAALERRELGKGATYADLARVVRAAAVDLYGPDSHEAQVVDSSWDTAGY